MLALETRNPPVAKDVTALIGKTPIVQINKLIGPDSAQLYAKLEWYNIGGSVKDRMSLYIIEQAEAAGRLTRDKTILEATSGNTGIALAMIAAAKGYRIKIVMPESVSVERRKIIEAYGAELVLSPGDKGTAGAIDVKLRMLKENPDEYIDVDQFKDPANILAHYQTTGNEIWEQTGGRVSMIVVGVGTAGTGVGCSMRLKEYNPEIAVVGITPKLGVSIQGMRNPKENNPTQLFREKWFDEVIEITEEEKKATFETARLAARREGLLIGMSAGAILYVALRKAKQLGKDKCVVAILPDSGEKYLSTPLFG
jgi:cysteine synthase